MAGVVRQGCCASQIRPTSITVAIISCPHLSQNNPAREGGRTKFLQVRWQHTCKPQRYKCNFSPLRTVQIEVIIVTHFLPRKVTSLSSSWPPFGKNGSLLCVVYGVRLIQVQITTSTYSRSPSQKNNQGRKLGGEVGG